MIRNRRRRGNIKTAGPQPPSSAPRPGEDRLAAADAAAGAFWLRRRAAAGARKRKLMPGGPVSAAGIASHESSQIFDKTCSVFRQLFSRNLARRARGGTNSEILRGTFNEMLHNLLSFLKVDKIAFQII